MPKILPQYAPSAILIWEHGLDKPPTAFVNGGAYESDIHILELLQKLVAGDDDQS